jgi:two-component system sensor histidine kinase/response regulator
MADTPLAGAGATGRQQAIIEHVAARALLEATTIDEAALRILEAICGALGWAHGALWTVDPTSDRLQCAQIWNPPGEVFPAFCALSRDLSFTRGVGLPGRVWASGAPAWIPDVPSDGNFPRAAVASREGLRSAFAFPISVGGTVTSVMEFFSREIRKPDHALLSTFAAVGDQIGMFVERRRALDELDRFFTLSLDMICVAGFDGYFKRVNPAWQRHLGWSEAELLSRPYLELIHPDDLPATRAAASRLAEGRNLVYFENRYMHKDGTLRWLLWAATPVPADRVIYATARDITERKAADETMAELVRALEVSKRRAEEAAATKSAFLANMSHEIRTPLNAILGMTALTLDTRLADTQRDYLLTVKSSGESLLALINDILDFSKVEARHLDLEAAPFDLRETVDEACRLLALRAAEKGLELACEVSPAIPEQLVGDAGRLRQVLVNILGNAVKFTTRGEVVLRVALDHTGRRVVLQFSVIDTGIGIPADKLAHIFQPFTQADSSTTRRYGGTGLGLAIAERLVELMGGRLWVESEVDRGSTFHFTAAFTRPAATAGGGDAVSRARGLEGLRVLVVDDNATNRRILEQMLRSWQMNPTAVADARTALAALRRATRRRRFDAVITDCQMPDADGFMLARDIRSDARVRSTPIVMLTSMGRADDVAECQRMGLDAYLTKPVKHSDLLDTLVSVFGTSARRPAAIARPMARPPRRLRILVAEDNAVNRRLVLTLLGKRGHVVHGVEDGQEAVDQAANGHFDAIVMDVQMPRLSGLEATAAIRARERDTGRHVPIIALTAHAMRGDRERCVAAGMDGYLTKPIDVDALVTTVERLGAATPPAAGPPARRVRAAPSAAVDFNERAALSHTGDREVLAQMVAIFRKDGPLLVGRVTRAVARRDAEALRQQAHALKGTAATLGGEAVRDTAAALEAAGRAGRLAGTDRLVATLARQMTRLLAALAAAGLTRRAPRRPAARPQRRRPAPRARQRS